MTLDSAEIAAVREAQYDDIAALRRRMAAAVQRDPPATVLSVGEGCDRVATFIGGCLAVGALPGATRLVVPLDLRAVPGSFHHAGPLAVADCRIAPMLGDVLAPPLRPATFEMVVSSMMIDDVNDPPAAVTSMLGLLVAGGRLLISGHGIDMRPQWRGIRELLASDHKDQVYPDQVEIWLHDAGAFVTHRWESDHTWVIEAVVS